MQHSKAVRLYDERFSVVLSHDVEDDTCNEHQQARDNKHDRADEGGEARYHAGLPEIHGYAAAKPCCRKAALPLPGAPRRSPTPSP